MTPEIKAAIEQQAENFANKNSVLDKEPFPYGYGFTCGAEYGYKLAEEKLDLAVRALKYCSNEDAYFNALDGGPHHVSDIFRKAREALKELGE